MKSVVSAPEKPVESDKRQRPADVVANEAAPQAEQNPSEAKEALPVKNVVGYARALRAIGDALESLHVQSFEVESRNDGYWVRAEKRRPSRGKKPPPGGPPRSSLRKIWHRWLGQSPPEPPSDTFEIRYAVEDLEQLDEKGQSRRNQLKGIADTSRLSQVLRLIGAYLDLKGARLSGFSLREERVTLRYETATGASRVEEHRVASLYDFAVSMYLQRADRKS